MQPGYTMRIDGIFDIAGKVALVTGGAQGIGKMIAEGFVRAGCRVYISTRNCTAGAQVAAELAAFGHCHALTADLSTPEGVKSLSEALTASESKLHVLVNNAGRTWSAPLESFPDRAWAGVMAVNVQSPFTLARDLLPLLKAAATEQDPARIINIGSIGGKRIDGISAFSYLASKAAVHHLSRAMAAHLAKDRITVNAIAPGFFETKMTAPLTANEGMYEKLIARIPLHRAGAPSDIAGLCVFLASPASAYITGTIIPLDGGMDGCQ
jgi:NAD(P)-dependent dehydrogenase (short-subunit alcohol dehydrogenase family)